MKKLVLSLLTMSTIGLMAQVEGTWKLAPKAGAFGVGPAKGDYSWWSVPEPEVTGVRACQFDDQFVFNADGTFQNIFGNETYREGWQGADGCGAPVAPHDGKTAAKWSFNMAAKTVTLKGKGAFLGLPKPYNLGELKAPADAPDSIVYEVTVVDMNNVIIEIKISEAGAYWKYELTRETASNTAIKNNMVKVFPNPVNNTLFVNATAAVNQLTIRDLSGKAVHTQTNVNTEKGIDVSFLNTGAYFISVETANGTQNAKFIKQ